YAGLRERLERVATGPRRRYAESVCWHGDGRRRDRIASSLFFELSAPVWARRAQDAEHLAPFLAAVEHCTSTERALDLGTGAGGTAALLAERFPEAEVVGMDGSRTMVRDAAEKHREPT